MKRWTLIGIAVVVAGAAIALILLLRADSRAGTAADPDTPSPTVVEQELDIGSGIGARPSLGTPEGTTEQFTGDGQPYREYVRSDGTVVRNHRASGVVDPDFVPMLPKPTGARTLRPEVLIAVRDAMRPIVHKCAEKLDADGFGEKPRMHGQITISIMEGHISVDRAALNVIDVAETDAEALMNCVRDPLQQLVLPAQGHEDVSEYMISLPFRLRR
jgi:hypothetical protein